MTGVKHKPKPAHAPTLYTVLGLPPATAFAELRARYLELAVLYHPDKGGDGEKFRQLTAAWTVLKDTGTRRTYDARLRLEREVCGECDGLGLVSGYKNGKYRKQMSCGECRGEGYL